MGTQPRRARLWGHTGGRAWGVMTEGQSGGHRYDNNKADAGFCVAALWSWGLGRPGAGMPAAGPFCLVTVLSVGWSPSPHAPAAPVPWQEAGRGERSCRPRPAHAPQVHIRPTDHGFAQPRLGFR